MKYEKQDRLPISSWVEATWRTFNNAKLADRFRQALIDAKVVHTMLDQYSQQDWKWCLILALAIQFIRWYSFRLALLGGTPKWQKKRKK